MSRQAQTESAYVQTVPDSKCLCQDRPRRKVDMSRLSCVQNFSCVLRAFEGKYVQTIPDRNGICPNFRAFMSRASCVHVQTIVRSSVFPDRVILNARQPLRAFISVWTYLVSVWDLSLGTYFLCYNVFLVCQQFFWIGCLSYFNLCVVVFLYQLKY